MTTTPTSSMQQTGTQAIRNVAIIAHVDHGKTTLVDRFLAATGSIPSHQDLGERILDSNDLERERGITILAKNISLYYRDAKINIIDTPGHADFGGEVERVLQMADGAIVLVDAAEGPMPQTRFVLRKAFEQKLVPVVVVNKIDRKDARADEVVHEIGDLFLELAEEVDVGDELDVLDFPVVYASAREGYAASEPNGERAGVELILDLVLDRVPAPTDSADGPLAFQVTTLDYSDYVGRIGIGRVYGGRLENGARVLVCGRDGDRSARVKELYLFDKLGKIGIPSVAAGDICAVTGIDDLQIGETLTDPEHPVRRPFTEVDRPTVSMLFCVNDSPFAGQDGRFVTSRQLRARLFKELEANVALRVEDTSDAGVFEVSGRGTLHLGILIETMRREGYEFQVGKPTVILREEQGVRLEPVEHLVVQTPESSAGKVIELIGARRGEMTRYEPQGERMLIEFRVPARGLIGIGSRLMTLTAGEAVVFHSFSGYEPYKGSVPGRTQGVMVSSESGAAIPYALFSLRDRGPFFIEPNQPVYKGMVVGEHCKEDDITVNVCRTKKLTNIRAAGSDKNVILSPPRQMSIEEALEYIEEDELLEVTPKIYRLRKKALDPKARRRESRR